MIREIEPPTRHPILGIQRPPPGKIPMHLMTEEYECEHDPAWLGVHQMMGADPGPARGRRMALRPCLPWRMVEGLREAEEAIVGLLLEKAPPYQRPFEQGFHLNAASSMAANRNRRGLAQNLIINPRDGEQFVERAYHAPGIEVGFDLHRRFGSFTYFGTYPGRDFWLFYSDLIPERTILCTYRGHNESDVLASYVETIDRSCISLNNEGVTDPLTYATTIVFAD